MFNKQTTKSSIKKCKHQAKMVKDPFINCLNKSLQATLALTVLVVAVSHIYASPIAEADAAAKAQRGQQRDSRQVAVPVIPVEVRL